MNMTIGQKIGSALSLSGVTTLVGHHSPTHVQATTTRLRAVAHCISDVPLATVRGQWSPLCGPRSHTVGLSLGASGHATVRAWPVHVLVHPTDLTRSKCYAMGPPPFLSSMMGAGHTGMCVSQTCLHAACSIQSTGAIPPPPWSASARPCNQARP